MNDKPFKTYNEQIALLEERGIDFSQEDSKSYAKKKLQRIGYYNLINGYSFMFKESANTYKQGTTVNEIFNLYNFDDKLRSICLEFILPIETNIKSLIAYYFPKAHPETNYLVYSNFNTSLKDANKKIPALLSDLQRQIASKHYEPSIKHYLKNHGYIPLWVLNNILTLGTISKFYSLMIQSEKQKISKTFNMSDNQLENVLTYISAIRNFSAHGNRLFCYRTKNRLCDTEYHKSLEIPRDTNNVYMYGKTDFFAVMIAFKMLLSRNEFKKIVKKIDLALKNLYQYTKVLTKKDILSQLGFPCDWKEKLLKIK